VITTPPSARKVILLVEDDDDIRLIVRETLEEAGYDVAEAPTSEMAIIALRTVRYDLVLMDMLLDSATSGKDVIDHLLANGFGRPVIVLMTGYAPEVVRLAFGGFEKVPPIIYKPIRNVEVLLAAVAKYMGPRP
jgi:CheY-like chemotaxis protein